MTEPVYPMVVDLSHWVMADDYQAVKNDGIVGVIYKATEGQGYNDPTYPDQQKAAKAVGLKWGAYHFADASNTQGQIDNFCNYAWPDPDEAFVLDWEDNPSGNGKMSVEQAKDWIMGVEDFLKRPEECIIYGGNTLKECIDGHDEFFAKRRLWLCQYGTSVVLPESWEAYWLWQYTDGNYGPTPHTIDGIGACDINSYKAGPSEKLVAEWASGKPVIIPPGPPVNQEIVDVAINASENVLCNVSINGSVVYAPSLRGATSRHARSSSRSLNLRNSYERWKGIRESRQGWEAAREGQE